MVVDCIWNVTKPNDGTAIYVYVELGCFQENPPLLANGNGISLPSVPACLLPFNGAQAAVARLMDIFNRNAEGKEVMHW